MKFKFVDYVGSPVKIFNLLHEWKKIERDEIYYKEWLISHLKKICLYANNHVPYYRELFDKCGFIPEKMDSLDYFQRIPILTKEIVRNNFETLQSDEIKKLRPRMCETSGSTGKPLHFYLDKNINHATFCLFYKTWSMADNWHLGQNQLVVSDYGEGEYNYADREYTYQWKNQILHLSSSHLSLMSIDRLVKVVEKYKPKFLRGYPSSLCLFGKLCEEKNIRLKFSHIFTGSETLLSTQKLFLEEFFGAKIIDHYTHWERTASICTCKCGKQHAHNYYGYHEVLDKSSNPIHEGVGRLICTGLYNLAMPLIRYDTHDFVTIRKCSKCQCGSVMPIIDSIEGRVEDAIETPDGRKITCLNNAVKYSHNIIATSIYQPEISQIIVKVVPGNGYSFEEDEKPLIRELRDRLGNEINIEIQKVKQEDIPKTKRGKVKFIVSDIQR